MDEQGRPLAGLLVAIAWSDAPAPEIAARTRDDGGFSFGLPPGAYEFVAYRDDREVARLRTRFEDLEGSAAEIVKMVARG